MRRCTHLIKSTVDPKVAIRKHAGLLSRLQSHHLDVLIVIIQKDKLTIPGGLGDGMVP